MKALSLQISSEHKLTKIRVVLTGSIEDNISIRVKQSKTLDFLTIWDINNDVELESFDHGKPQRYTGKTMEMSTQLRRT